MTERSRRCLNVDVAKIRQNASDHRSNVLGCSAFEIAEGRLNGPGLCSVGVVHRSQQRSSELRVDRRDIVVVRQYILVKRSEYLVAFVVVGTRVLRFDHAPIE